MPNLTTRGDLAIAELVFYCPSFLFSLFLLFKHGATRNLGWVYLTTLSILRIVGSACTLYSEANNDYSSGLLEAAAITSAVGTAPLLLALLGFMQRVNLNTSFTSSKTLPQQIFALIQLVALVALILAIVGGSKESSSDPNHPSDGQDYLKAGGIIFLVIYFGEVLVTLYTVRLWRSVPSSERKLVVAGVLALPFLLVRVAFTVAVSFGKPGGHFYFKDPSVWLEIFMQFLMEAIVIIIYSLAGFLTPRQSAVASGGQYVAKGGYEPVAVENGVGMTPYRPNQRRNNILSASDQVPAQPMAHYTSVQGDRDRAQG